MNIQARIQEAMRRRHKNEDGFTLIELLVVILIIAILAAVAIFALLNSLGSAKKSNAKETLRSAQSTVESTRAGLGDSDYSGISTNGTGKPTARPGTPTALDNAEKDVFFTNTPLSDAPNIDKLVYIRATATNVTLGTRDKDNNCFFILLSPSNPTGYASSNAGAATTACTVPNVVANPSSATPATPSPSTWYSNQNTGWKR